MMNIPECIFIVKRQSTGEIKKTILYIHSDKFWSFVKVFFYSVSWKREDMRIFFSTDRHSEQAGITLLLLHYW